MGTGTDELAISAHGLRKSYGEFEAVRGIDLEVKRGEVFAFLGPNGAGKTTTTEIFEGYLEATSGEVRVLGEDPAKGGAEWRNRIGIVLQKGGLYERLTVRESVRMFAGYFRKPLDVEDTIKLVGLENKADVQVGRLSGGQRRRVDVALALIGDPELLFLDEPTTGFDPAARRQTWTMISGLRDLGKTVFLTTHYMEEAQVLADRVAILVGGRIVAEGTPSSLVAHERLGGAEISFVVPDGADLSTLPAGIAGDLKVEDPGIASLRSEQPVVALNALTGWALANNLPLAGLSVSPPRLEDIYLEVTGADNPEGVK